MKNQKASSHQKPLSLVDVSSAFVVLALGISLSILVFLLELIFKRINDHYFADNHKQVNTIPARPLEFKRRQQKRFVPKSNNRVSTKKIQSAPAKMMSGEPIIPKARPVVHNIKPQGHSKVVPAARLVKQVQAKRAVTVIPTKKIAKSIEPPQIQAEIHFKVNNNPPVVNINNQRPIVNINNSPTESKQQVGHSATGKTMNKNQAAAAIGNKRKKISALSFDKIEILE